MLSGFVLRPVYLMVALNRVALFGADGSVTSWPYSPCSKAFLELCTQNVLGWHVLYVSSLCVTEPGVAGSNRCGGKHRPSRRGRV